MTGLKVEVNEVKMTVFGAVVNKENWYKWQIRWLGSMW